MSDHLSQSTCLEMLHPKTDEHLNPSVEVHHLVGKLSTAETLLTEVQRKVPACPGNFLVINVCKQGKTLCSPCIKIYMFIIILDMFRAVLCSSSGGQIVLLQPLVSSLCKRTYSRLRADCSPLSTGILYGRLESDDTRCCSDTICPPEDEHSTARNMSRIMM